MQQTAYLSNKNEYTTFVYGERTITFLTSKNLERYIRVVSWDNGYLVVISTNYGREQEEDYIDLVPILNNLMIDPEEFLAPIKEVRIKYV